MKTGTRPESFIQVLWAYIYWPVKNFKKINLQKNVLGKSAACF